jgi:hypothetical protein
VLQQIGIEPATVAIYRFVKEAGDAEYLRWLADENGYLVPRKIPGGRWAAISRLMFTHAIITGKMLDLYGLDNRWCYKDYISAQTALDAWDGTGEPEGWHRHPVTGRRRLEGDELLEYLAP